MSNSDLLSIVAVDNKTGNIGVIHYFKNIKRTQLQEAQINAVKTNQQVSSSFFVDEARMKRLQ